MKQSSSCLVMGMGVKVSKAQWVGTEKQHKETFGDDGYLHYLDCCDGFTGIFTCQNIKNVHFNYAVYYYVNYTLIKTV